MIRNDCCLVRRLFVLFVLFFSPLLKRIENNHFSRVVFFPKQKDIATCFFFPVLDPPKHGPNVFVDCFAPGGPFWAQPRHLEVVVSQSRRIPLNCPAWKQHYPLHLNMDGWKTILFFWDGGFLVRAVSCRECNMKLYHAVPMSLGRIWKMNFLNDPHPCIGHTFVKSLSSFWWCRIEKCSIKRGPKKLDWIHAPLHSYTWHWNVNIFKRKPSSKKKIYIYIYNMIHLYIYIVYIYMLQKAACKVGIPNV